MAAGVGANGQEGSEGESVNVSRGPLRTRYDDDLSTDSLPRRSTSSVTFDPLTETNMASSARRRGARKDNGTNDGEEADEAAPIIRNAKGPASDYQAISPSIAARRERAEGDEEDDRVGRSSGDGEQQRRRDEEAERAAANTERKEAGWWRGVVEKYGSVELENKGSVARDHLALERTFLAWLRTSLSFASIGIAITQLFRLNTTISPKKQSSSAQLFTPNNTPDLSSYSILQSPQAKLRHVGKPLGATFIAISILILFIGFHRYFEAQHYVIRGKFPASRGSVILVTAVAGALIVSSLVVILAVAPGAFER